MEDNRMREENAAAEEGEEQRAGSFNVISVQDVKDGGATSLKRSEVRSVVRVKGKNQVIRWDSFLPRRFIRVLLVENDDSTRHIVSALLRKCSYQVAAVADGLKAWEVLKEKHYNFDLVLTEVVTPSLSGISLLSNIMSNEICKNIPVVMMSSHNSIGIVFKCMMKGAADFLVKPVRNNELRNLWQHVWRKYYARLEAVSDNVAAINHGSSTAVKGSRIEDTSDKKIDSQRFCSNPEAKNGAVLKLREIPESENGNFVQEMDCPKGMSVMSLMKRAKQKVVLFVLHLIAISFMANKYCYIDDKPDFADYATGIDINLSLSIQAVTSTKNILKTNGFYDGSPCREENQASTRSKVGAILESENLDEIGGTTQPSKGIIDFIGATTTERNKCSILEDKDHAENSLCKNKKSSDVQKSTINSGSPQLWELSLWGPQLGFDNNEVFQEKHVLNHSHASAFSRYDGGKIHVSCPTSGASSATLCIRTNGSNSANCHINLGIDNGKRIHFPLIGRLTSPHRSGSGNKKEDVGPSTSVALRDSTCVGHSSTEKTVLARPQLEARPLPIPVGPQPFQNLCAGYSATVQPIFGPGPSQPLCGSSEFEKVTPESLSSITSAQDYNHLVNGHQYIDTSDSVENHQAHQLKRVTEDQKVNIKSPYPSVVLHTFYEIADHIGNCNQHITGASGSNGTNDDTSAAINTGTALESGNEDGFQKCYGKGLDHSCSQGEAALTRFHFKRKDRCFEKKVRNHRREKLAEQRPRLKGQFVCQAVAESARIVSESDD